MSKEKQHVAPWFKVVAFCSLLAAVSVAWLLMQNEKAADVPSVAAFIQSAHAGTSVDSHATKVDKLVPEDEAADILARMKQVRPDLSVTNLRFSHIDGVYKANLQGSPVFFSADGQFFIAGEMYQITTDQLVNLEEQERRQQEAAFAPQRAQMLKAIPKEDTVLFPAKGDTKARVYVFTDIDCGFCRKLHRQMDEMQALGIEVRYLGFPRAGVNSKSAEKLATTWCADDRNKVMTQFKRGQNVPLKTCEPNPIADQYVLGQAMGVRGTPAIVLESGQMVPGAVSTQQLIDILKQANLY